MDVAAAAVLPRPNYNVVHRLLTTAANHAKKELEQKSLVPPSSFKVFAMDNIQKKFSSAMKKLVVFENDGVTKKNYISAVATHLTCAVHLSEQLTQIQTNTQMSPEVLLSPDSRKF